jgi:hypothetical protein
MKLRVELLKSVVLEFRTISLRFQPDLSHATKDYADRIPPSRSRASVRRAEVLPGSLHGCSEHSRCWDNFARANGFKSTYIQRMATGESVPWPRYRTRCGQTTPPALGPCRDRVR